LIAGGYVFFRHGNGAIRPPPPFCCSAQFTGTFGVNAQKIGNTPQPRVLADLHYLIDKYQFISQVHTWHSS
jgi:hypothetical protein